MEDGSTVDGTPGLIKLSKEFTLNGNNELEVNSLNVDKLVQTGELLLDCGNAAERTYS